MAGTMKGSCLCGGVRFGAQGEPLFQGFCQCLDCRKVGSGRAAVIGILAGSTPFFHTKRTRS